MPGLKISVSQLDLCCSDGLRALSVIWFDFIHFFPPSTLVRRHKAMQQLVTGAEQLINYPQLGIRLEEFALRDVRRIIIGDYGMRYELTR